MISWKLYKIYVRTIKYVIFNVYILDFKLLDWLKSKLQNIFVSYGEFSMKMWQITVKLPIKRTKLWSKLSLPWIPENFLAVIFERMDQPGLPSGQMTPPQLILAQNHVLCVPAQIYLIHKCGLSLGVQAHISLLSKERVFGPSPSISHLYSWEFRFLSTDPDEVVRIFAVFHQNG